MSTDADTQEFSTPLIDFDNVAASPSVEFLESTDEPDSEFVEKTYSEPDAGFIKDKARSRKAVTYTNKISDLFNGVFRVAIASEATVPDAAAISMHVKPISTAIGNLADADPRVERAIDFITEGTENPYLTVVAAVAPLVFQILRNHEPQIEPKMRGIRIPFGKRKGEHLKMRFGIKLRGIRVVSNDPDALAKSVFGNPNVQAALAKQGLSVAGFNATRG